MSAALGALACPIGHGHRSSQLLIEHGYRRCPAIDQILFLDLKGSFGTSAPGRMAPMTAIAFVAMGLALLSLDRKTQRGHRPSQVLSLFAALIAMAGCFNGMRVRLSSRELGRLTTVAVVQSIFCVILADALFAVLFLRLNI